MTMPRSGPPLAKLTRPRTARALPRQRLFETLDEARASRAAVAVVGPPGAGKTTLVASWLDARRIKGIWYHVDAGDADLAAFFYYLGRAAVPFARSGQRHLPLLTPEYLSDVAGFARRFFRELFSRLPQDATLVLDNYHQVDAGDRFHRIVADAVEEVPAKLTLVLIGRQDPPQCHARAIANDSMALVTWEALQLTLSETQAIAQARRCADSVALAALHRSTGGWAAGLMLALERVRQGAAPIDVEHAVSEASFGYFASEIFERLPQNTRHLLLHSACLPHVAPAIARALTGRPDAAAILDDLYRRRLFVDKRPGSEPSYRYHPLFHAFLRARAAATLQPELLEQLRGRAAALLEEGGDADAAVALYCEAKRWDEAQRLIVAHAPILLSQGRWRTLDEWVARLPAEQTGQSAWLAYWIGVSRLPLDPRTARERLEQAYRQFHDAGEASGALLAAAGVCQAIQLEGADFHQIDRWVPVLDQLMHAAPAFATPRAELAAHTGILAALTLRAPAHRLAQRSVDRILELLVQAIDINQRLAAAGGLMLYCCYMGKLDTAWRLAGLIEPLLNAPEAAPLVTATWYLYRGYLSVCEHRPEQGLDAFARAEAIAEERNLAYVQIVSYTMHARLLKCSDPRRAQALIEKAGALCKTRGAHDQAHFLGTRANWAADRGEHERAVEYAREAIGYVERTGVLFQQLIYRRAFSWALAETGRFDEARTHIAEAGNLIERTGATCLIPLFSLCEANLARRMDDAPRYPALLAAAFAGARRDPAAGRFIFWTPVEGARRLCADALRYGIEVDLVQSFIVEYGIAPELPAPENWPWPVKVRTLGGFELLVKGAPPAFSRKSPRRTLALLAAIVALGGRNVPEERLIDALWPDEEGDAGHSLLASALHRLRELLGDPQAIQQWGGKLSLDPVRCWVDALAFQQLAEQSAPAALDAALALYGGAFLCHEADAPWAVPMRERLRASFVDAATRRGAQLEQARDDQAALACSLRALAADELAEPLYQGVMRCYYGLDRRSEGLTAYQRLRERLSLQLGGRPSTASERLYQSLRSA
jgi:ATP/maltotriose-dependent transcriptional regulator MalT/DNA-binding SARP family transcriptional activator